MTSMGSKSHIKRIFIIQYDKHKKNLSYKVKANKAQVSSLFLNKYIKPILCLDLTFDRCQGIDINI